MLKAPAPKADDLEQSAGHCHVLQEVDDVVRIGEIGVEEHRRGHAVQRKDSGGRARPKADNQHHATDNLDRDRSCVCQRRR